MNAVALIILLSSGTQLQAGSFIRGDTNRDGEVGVSDVINTLGFLFLGDPVSLGCQDAADSNDDASIDIADAISTLSFLFLGRFDIPPPGPRFCGPDPTQDALTCSSFDFCLAGGFARVLQVSVTGSPDEYIFSVTVESPDTGCDQYADWWEVISPDGKLLYRRILAHSHTSEQPFRRSGGAVIISAETEVIVRAHMNPLGYGNQALQGSPSGGFESVELPSGFAAGLAQEPPLPTGCAF